MTGDSAVDLRPRTIHKQMYGIKCVNPAQKRSRRKIRSSYVPTIEIDTVRIFGDCFPAPETRQKRLELQFLADFSVAFAQITAYQSDLWQLTDPLYGLDQCLSVLLRQFPQITTLKVRQRLQALTWLKR